MGEGEAGGLVRHAASIAVAVVVLALLGCGTLALLPRPYEPPSARLKTQQDLVRAYVRVQPGETRASDLAALGFDRTVGNVQAVSYLGVMERFAGDSRTFDRLDPALQTCIEARDRCTAFVFRAGSKRSQGILSLFGFGAANAADRDPEVTLLVQDGRVAFKAISGVAPAAVARELPPSVSRVSALPASERSVY
jgi:hypothetical protein